MAHYPRRLGVESSSVVPRRQFQGAAVPKGWGHEPLSSLNLCFLDPDRTLGRLYRPGYYLQTLKQRFVRRFGAKHARQSSRIRVPTHPRLLGLLTVDNIDVAPTGVILSLGEPKKSLSPANQVVAAWQDGNSAFAPNRSRLSTNDDV